MHRSKNFIIAVQFLWAVIMLISCDSEQSQEQAPDPIDLIEELQGEWKMAYTMKPEDGPFLMGTWAGTCCSFTKDSMFVYEYLEDHHFADGFSTYLYTDTIREELEKYSISYVAPDSLVLSGKIRLKYSIGDKYHKLSNNEYAFLFYRD